MPVEEVALIIPVKPTQGVRGQQPLQGEDPQPQRHQVTALPLAKPVVTASQLHRLLCPACGELTRAQLPLGVPPGGFGPRVQALAALGTGASHLSRRTTPSLLEDLFWVPWVSHRAAPPLLGPSGAGS